MNTYSTNCEICHESESKYKCPTCGVRYCSLKCYKDAERHVHSTDPQESEEPNKETELGEDEKKEGEETKKGNLNLKTEELNTLYQNSSDIQELLQYNTVKFHLAKVYRILSTNTNGIGQDNMNMNKDSQMQLAVDYLNTLRYGGIHYNEAIEEFCQHSLKQLDSK